MPDQYSWERWTVRLLQPRLPWSQRRMHPADVSEKLCETLLMRDHLLEDAAYSKVTPNRFIVELSESNYNGHFQPIERQIVKQWSDRMVEHLLTANSRLGRKEYRFAGRIRIDIRSSPDLKDYQVRILCRIEPDNSQETAPQKVTGGGLELLSGGQRWPLNLGVNTVGRDESCSIRLDSSEIQERRLISSQHAYVLAEHGQYILFDGSTDGRPSRNGTFLNGGRVPPGGAPLQEGDIIILAALDPLHPRPDTPGTAAFRFSMGKS